MCLFLSLFLLSLRHWPLSGVQRWARGTVVVGQPSDLMHTEKNRLAQLHTSSPLYCCHIKKLSLRDKQCHRTLKPALWTSPLVSNSDSLVLPGSALWTSTSFPNCPNSVLQAGWPNGCCTSRGTPGPPAARANLPLTSITPGLWDVFPVYTVNLWPDLGNPLHLFLAYFLLSHWHGLYLLQGTVCLILAHKASGKGELLASRDIESKDTTCGSLWAPNWWRLVECSGEASLHAHGVFIGICHCPAPNTRYWARRTSMADPIWPLLCSNLRWELLVH